GGADDMSGDGGDDMMFGDAGEDTMSGGAGNDSMSGGGDNDIMSGNGGADDMFGDSGDDEMYGDAGNDTMSGGTGNDTMFGNSGDDVMNGNAGADLMYGGSGSFDSMNGGADSDVMYGDNGDDAEIGDDDIMSGGAGNDMMFGEGGADHMYGNGGDDFVSGGFGNDTMHGNAGEDRMSGGSGDDIMFGDADNDVMTGGFGNDVMDGGTGEDKMYGSSGDDTMSGGADNDYMRGLDDNDSMSGDGGDDRMHGDDGHDKMSGGAGNDTMSGGSGNDDMSGGSGSDSMQGGVGDDSMSGDSGNDLMLGGGGNDTMSGGVGTDTMYGNNDDDLMSGNGGADNMIGGRGNDTMSGNSGADHMFGEDGEDIMSGGSGNDTMSGGDGNDDMSGGSGDDRMYGKSGDDEMTGGAGNDTMFGGSGSFDVMSGGADSDVMYGDNGNHAEIGDDDIMYGNAGDDDMWGEGGADLMSGDGGADYMSGGFGNDTMSGGDGNDILSGDDGDDTLRWTMADNVGSTVDNYDGEDGTGDTLELYFTQDEFELPGAEEAIAEFANRVERGDTTATLEIGGKTLTASNFEHVAVHVDNVEIPVLLDDLIVTDENEDVIQTITDTNTTPDVGTPDQDFVPNAPVVTTFDAPKAVELTMPNGAPALVFAASEWVEGPSNIWTLDLLDGTVADYGVLTFDATDPENVTVKLDVPEGGDTIYDPMDDGEVATIVFDYSAQVEGSEEATVTININGVNDAPVANDDIVITNTLGEIYIPKYALLKNDTDIENDPLQVDSVTPPASMHDDYEAYVRTVSVGSDGNRVINGSFEDQGDGSNVNVNHGSWATYDDLPGWKIHTPDPSDDPSDVGVDAPIELQFGGTGGISAQDGNAKMEMDSHNEGGYTSSNAHVYQDVPTVSGEALKVSFWYSPRTTSTTNDVNVFWNGALIAELSGTTPGWTEYTFDVVGTEDTTRLEFRGEPSEDTLGGYIDNVYVGNPNFLDGSFTYTVSDEEPLIDVPPHDHYDDANVDVSYNGGDALLEGGAANEIVVGGDGADTIRGGDGDDTIIGGGGDDVISGGSDVNGNGEDTFHYMDTDDGHDEISFFDGSEDVINLDELFDELGIVNDSAEARADMINLEVTNSPNPFNPVETKITIDGTESEFSITLKNVDLGNSDGDLTAEQLNLAGIFVGDES
ncbi:MAG: hypothetical protein KUG81_04500, partial [Gammaproteobacteria bacterium]|nr:hypothetical protein [Gammaproteobacteria bacterium]